MPARPVGAARRAVAVLLPVAAVLATAVIAATPASAAPAPPTTARGAATATPVHVVAKPAAPVRARVVPAATRVLAVAASLAGRPYAYGGTGPRSFDCSGYTAYVFRHAVGRVLPHSSARQYTVVHHVARSAIRPGDLIFFVSGGHIYHVAIYAGRGRIWHAPHTGDHVRLAAIYSSSWVAGRVL